MPKAGKKKSRVESTTALAEHLGLSRWTVSRALNDHADVKPATRERIRKAMQELGFEPNPMARGLKGGKTHSIGICLQELDSSPLLARKTSLLQHLLRERNHRATLEFTSGSDELETDSIRHFLAMRVDGIVLLGSTLTADREIVAELRAAGKPVVAIDPVHDLPFPTVRLDRAAAMRLALEHLHGLGHRRFAFLGIARDVPYGEDRLVALRREMRRLGLGMRDHVVQISNPRQPLYDYDYGYELAGEFLELADPPPAIVALNDRIAIGALKRLAESGARLPEDYSLVGFDNQEVTRYCRPDLTTIDQEVPSVIERTIDVLFHFMKEGSPKTPASKTGPPHLVAPRLRIRGSTGPNPLNR